MMGGSDVNEKPLKALHGLFLGLVAMLMIGLLYLCTAIFVDSSHDLDFSHDTHEEPKPGDDDGIHQQGESETEHKSKQRWNGLGGLWSRILNLLTMLARFERSVLNTIVPSLREVSLYVLADILAIVLVAMTC